MATLSELVVKIGGDISDLEKKMTAAQRVVNQAGARMQEAGQRMTLAVSLPIAAAAGFAVRAAAQMDSLTRGLNAVTGSAEETARQMQRLEAVARLPGLGFAEAIQGSIRLQAVRIDAVLAERALVAFGNAIASVGGGKAELDGITLALSQIAGKGKVAAEEINQLAERAPQVRAAMIDAFGTADTEAIQRSGIGTIEFITRLVAELEKLPPVTGGARNAFENFSDALFRAQAVIGDKLLPALAPLVEGLTRMLESVRSLDPATVRWGIALAGMAAVMGPLITTIGALSQAIIAMKVAGVALGTTVAVGAPLLIGLAAISALFIKNKLDALAAGGAVKEYERNLATLDKNTARFAFEDISAKIQKVKDELAKAPATVMFSTSSMMGGSSTPIANPRVKELKEELKVLNEQWRTVVRRNAELNIPGVDQPDPPPIVDPAATKKMAELVERMRELRQEAFLAGQEVSHMMRELFAGQELEKRLGLDAFAFANLAGGRHRTTGPTAPGIVTTTTGASADAGLPRATLGLRAQALGGQALQALAPTFDRLKGAGLNLLNAFNPLSILATVFGEALKSLAPALEPLVNIVGRVGGILGKALLPILEALWPVFKLVVVAATYVGQVFFNVAGGILTAVGSLILGIGKALSKLPGIGNNNDLVKAGRGMLEMADGFLEGAGALATARDEIKKLDWESATAPLAEAAQKAAESLSNVPRVLNLALLRHRASTVGIAGVLTPRATDIGGSIPAGTPVMYFGEGSIRIDGRDRTGEELLEDIGRAAASRARRGGVSRLTLAIQGG